MRYGHDAQLTLTHLRTSDGHHVLVLRRIARSNLRVG
jgi:hypothetical protein